MSAPFGDRLAEAVRRCRTPLVVGLDPHWEGVAKLFDLSRTPSPADAAEAVHKFCTGVIDAVRELVPGVKVQVAFFERWGPPGMEALARVIAHAHRAGLLVLVDAKRGDIGSTATAYAQAYLGPEAPWPADALTVNPYLGPDTFAPFVQLAQAQDRGVFVLVKTSNPESHTWQDLTDREGTAVFEHIAQQVEQLAQSSAGQSGYGSVGAVVGATYPEQLARLRSQMPHAWLLVPGLGAQGATAADVAGAFDSQGLGAVVNCARAILFAWQREPFSHWGARRWQRATEQATRFWIEQLRQRTPGGKL